jgi:aspartyl aminopeptidase
VTAILDDLLAFLAASPTPYHAVVAASSRLAAAGFRPLSEHDTWASLAGGRFYVTRNDGAIVAFVVPTSSGKISGFRVVGAHTDSPNLRLKPLASYDKHGYRQLGVEVYGGALLNSWLDRDLGLAGRVIVRDGARLATRLVRIDRPLARVPQLAIHLDREVNDKGLVLNRQEHLPPIIGLARDGARDVTKAVATELGVDVGAIVSADLMLHDLTAPTRGGLDEEMIFSARLDNQAMCHAAIHALIDAASAAGGSDVVPVAVLFDHEEVGSSTTSGAGAPLLPAIFERIVLALGGTRGDYLRLVAGSFCVSADMAHALHPNYPDRHEARHRPVLNGGPVIKSNAQQRYATSASTAALFAELCRGAGVPVQYYAHRTDLPCGSTIGPITATLMGIRTVDVGNPMLSMHSARELGGTDDPAMMTKALSAFYVAPDSLA